MEERYEYTAAGALTLKGVLTQGMLVDNQTGRLVQWEYDNEGREPLVNYLNNGPNGPVFRTTYDTMGRPLGLPQQSGSN